MSLYVFSTVVLSLVFMLVFSSWWVAGAPFSVHLSALLIAVITALSIMTLVALYPTLLKRSASKRLPAKLNETSWANDVSSHLSTPAAVIDSYTVIFSNKAFLTDLGMLGMDEQIIGMPITNIIHPGDHPRLAMLLAQTLQNSEAKTASNCACCAWMAAYYPRMYHSRRYVMMPTPS